MTCEFQLGYTARWYPASSEREREPADTRTSSGRKLHTHPTLVPTPERYPSCSFLSTHHPIIHPSIDIHSSIPHGATHGLLVGPGLLSRANQKSPNRLAHSMNETRNRTHSIRLGMDESPKSSSIRVSNQSNQNSSTSDPTSPTRKFIHK